MDLLAPIHQNHLKSHTPPASFIDEQDYQILTLKFLRMGEGEIHEFHESILFTSADPVIIHHQSGTEEKHESDYKVLKRVKAFLDDEINMITVYMDEIAKLEDHINERKTPRYFLSAWFKLKKDLLRIERVFQRRSILLREFAHGPRKVSSKEARHLLQELSLKVDSHARGSTHMVSRLDSIHRFYESLKQDRINTNIYLLALVSSVFLPLNLIVGFFGINTENLYFTDNPQGTNYVLLLLLGVFFTLVVGLPTLRFLNQKVFGGILPKGFLNFTKVQRNE